MFAKNDLNSVALNMSTVRLQVNSYDYVQTFDWHRDLQELTRTMEKIIYYIWGNACYSHLFFNYLFCMLIFVISLELLKMTWEGGKILWFLSLIFITQSISKKIWKRKLKKMKKLFSPEQSYNTLQPSPSCKLVWNLRWKESLTLCAGRLITLREIMGKIIHSCNFYFFFYLAV